MRIGMRRDLLQNLSQPNLRLPPCGFKRLAGIQNQPRNIIWTLGAIGHRLMRPETLIAPIRQLPQRHRIRRAARNVHQLSLLATIQLNIHQASKIARMQGVAHLKSPTTKAQILDRTPRRVSMQPVRKNALLRCAELSSSRQYSTSIYPHANSKCAGILPRQQLRCELGRAVKRNWSLSAEAFSNASQTGARRPRPPVVERKSGIFDPQR